MAIKPNTKAGVVIRLRINLKTSIAATSLSLVFLMMDNRNLIFSWFLPKQVFHPVINTSNDGQMLDRRANISHEEAGLHG